MNEEGLLLEEGGRRKEFVLLDRSFYCIYLVMTRIDVPTAFATSTPLLLAHSTACSRCFITTRNAAWNKIRVSPRVSHQRGQARQIWQSVVANDTDTTDSQKVASSLEAGLRASSISRREDVLSIAIVAHVDHGKTTLVDAMLQEANVFRANETVQERIMDSNDLERERGITILAKNASVDYNGVNIQIIDTPGHSDFSSEVERVLGMADGVVLLVDSVEGPKPQTRFVVKKAIEMGKKIALIVNKIDRPNARPEFVVDATFDLMAELGASDAQMDFDICYASALKSMSGTDPEDLKDNLKDVFDVILKLPRPMVAVDAPLQLMIASVDYDDFKGRMGIGRLSAGTMKKGGQVFVKHPKKEPRSVKIAELYKFDKLGRVNVGEAKAGDIVMFSGIDAFDIGDTVCANAAEPLKPIDVEEPTVRMAFAVNTSEFMGREGKYVTSRNIRDRLEKELERNVGLRVDFDASTPDSFEVCGRGALHLTILIETMRREGYEFMVGPPTVIYKTIDGTRCEPFETVEIEVPNDYMGAAVDLIGRRKGEMKDMGGLNSEGMVKVTYEVPTRGLLGVKNALMTATRGTAVMNTLFAGYRPYAGDMQSKDQGSLLAYETGKVTSYGLEGAQNRGRLFIKPGAQVYKNQIVGVHQRPGDLAVNICRMKALTNYRSATKEVATGIQGMMELSLDDAIEYIGQDEVAEITPENVRLAKTKQKKNQSRRS